MYIGSPIICLLLKRTVIHDQSNNWGRTSVWMTKNLWTSVLTTIVKFVFTIDTRVVPKDDFLVLCCCNMSSFSFRFNYSHFTKVSTASNKKHVLCYAIYVKWHCFLYGCTLKHSSSELASTTTQSSMKCTLSRSALLPPRTQHIYTAPLEFSPHALMWTRDGQTIDPLEDDRWMERMRVARVFSRSCSTSGQQFSTGALYSSCLKGSSSMRTAMFFRK